MRKWGIILFPLFLLVSFISISAQDFSKEEAFKHIEYLAGKIGPRPMGSPQEKAALEYVAAKLEEYGCTVEWHSITRYNRGNTSSGNVIGRFQGLSDREIVIGGHIDSAGPEIPGANDDASGVAVVLELARVLCKQPHNSTLVFVAFGGEESGLVGSRYFVDNYPLKNVALMLQLDMANNDSPLTLWIDTHKHQTPKWLVSAAIDIYHSLGYRNIDYATHFQTLNKSMGGGAGSDHEPFMSRDIPAIAFVSDVTAPIHTRNDSVENFKIDGLERSGKLLLELIKKFDREMPEENKGHYMLLMLWEKPIFIPPSLIKIFNLLSIVIAIVALYILRKKRVGYEEDKKIRLSWPKVAIHLLIIVIMIFASEWFIQLLKGRRFSWYAYPTSHLLFAISFALLGIWLALQTTRKWKLRKDVFFYLIRGAGYFVILIILLWLIGGARFALYPAFGLLFLSLGCLVPWSWLKGLLLVLSPYLMFRIVLPDYYKFLYRSISLAGRFVNTPGKAFLMSAGLIFFIFLWSMPFILGFAAVYRSYEGDLFWLKRFRKRISLIPIGVLIISGTIYLLILPSYTSTWEQEVTVTQKLDGESDRTYIEFASNDYLKGIEANISGKVEKLNTWKCTKEIDHPLEMDWVEVGYVFQPKEDHKEKIVYLNIMLDFAKMPYTVSLRLTSGSEIRVEDCNVQYYLEDSQRAVVMYWYSFPQRKLQPELKLKLANSAKLDALIKATFLDTPLIISCQGENTHFRHRAEIVRKIDLLQEKEKKD